MMQKDHKDHEKSHEKKIAKNEVELPPDEELVNQTGF